MELSDHVRELKDVLRGVAGSEEVEPCRSEGNRKPLVSFHKCRDVLSHLVYKVSFWLLSSAQTEMKNGRNGSKRVTLEVIEIL